jgi:hypothetical protein
MRRFDWDANIRKTTATYFNSLIPENVITFSKLLNHIETRTIAVQSFSDAVALNGFTKIKKELEIFLNNADQEWQTSVVLKIALVAKQDELELLVDYAKKLWILHSSNHN